MWKWQTTGGEKKGWNPRVGDRERGRGIEEEDYDSGKEIILCNQIIPKFKMSGLIQFKLGRGREVELELQLVRVESRDF